MDWYDYDYGYGYSFNYLNWTSYCDVIISSAYVSNIDNII